MFKLLKPVILNSEGKPIQLSAPEQRNVKWLASGLRDRYGDDPRTPFLNALGYDVAVTTLTSISKKISEQKFFEVMPADFVPMVVGQGAWSDQITTYRSFEMAEEFETGILNTGSNNARLATADAGVDAVNVPVQNWGKSIGWTIFNLEQAAKSGNWDLVSAKEKSRKMNWDLGIQRIMFLGMNGVPNVMGLLTQTGCTNDTTTLTKPISTMTPAELKAFTAALIEKYRSNCARTAWPTHFAIPESDYNGLASQASPDFPIKSTLQLLEEAFQLITRNKQFKILPIAYADAEYHSDVASIAGKQVYALYNYDEESLRSDLPVDYTTTLANSNDNFSFQNVGYGQFTGVMAYRPLELMYFTFSA